MVFVATSGGEQGPATGWIAAASVFVGGVCYTLATAIGISAAMAAYPALFRLIRAAGIVYLVYLGLKQLNRARDTSPAPAEAHARGHTFRTGLIIALTNPQLAAFFLAFLPQFVSADRGAVWLQFLALGLVFNCCSLLVMSTIGIGAGVAGHAQLGGTRFRQVMRAIAGIAFIAVAVRSAAAMRG
jgi:threonine/homoserine/homoserine lactone efflux protein